MGKSPMFSIQGIVGGFSLPPSPLRIHFLALEDVRFSCRSRPRAETEPLGASLQHLNGQSLWPPRAWPLSPVDYYLLPKDGLLKYGYH
jgi:hypothetical protein